LFIEGDAFTEVEKGIRVAFARGGVNGLLSLGGEFLEESELSEGLIGGVFGALLSITGGGGSF